MAIIISLLFIPSIIFWSSGILKDTIASAALMVLVANFIMVYKQLKIDWKNILMIAVTGFVLIKIKHYLAIAAIFFAGILIAHMVFKRFKTKWGFLLGIALLCTAMTATQLIHPYLNVERLPWVLYENNQAIISKTKDTSNTGILIEGNDWSSILSQIPKALLTGLFRPSINDSIPAYGVIHQIENMILGSLLIMSLIIALKKKIELDKPLLVASISAILLLAVLLSLSTPNFGSLVRYKNAYMPFLFIISSVLPFRYLTSKALNK
ncbi:MAG: hypothetical protein HRT61_22605 [Ekhidna sp.]|nr:hypothetical protein [Ekhidna sp.]